MLGVRSDVPPEVLPTSVPAAPVAVASGVRCGVASPGVRSEVLAPGSLAPLLPAPGPVLEPEGELSGGEVDVSANASVNPPAVSASVAALTVRICKIVHVVLELETRKSASRTFNRFAVAHSFPTRQSNRANGSSQLRLAKTALLSLFRSDRVRCQPLATLPKSASGPSISKRYFREMR